MADKKISALTAASVPLTGTEVLPIVQGGSTVKVSVDNLTTGKAVSASSLTLSGGTVNTIPFLNASKAVTTSSALQFDGLNIGLGVTPSASVLRSIESGFGVFIGRDASNIVHNAYYASGGWSYISTTFASQALQDNGEHIWYTAASGTAGNLISFNERMKLTEPGNLTLNSGNLVIGTAGKGIDFSAATHAAGMTSELLNDYEEGNWTPVGNNITFASASGKYTRIGRQVIVTFDVTLPSTANADQCQLKGLPFTVGSGGGGGASIGYTTNSNVVTFLAGDTGTSLNGYLFGGSALANVTYSGARVVGSCTYFV
jgi:hypothetical protein